MDFGELLFFFIFGLVVGGIIVGLMTYGFTETEICEVLIDEQQAFDDITIYDPENYNCVNKTNDFNDLMKDNYDLTLLSIGGYNDDEDMGHAFSCIPFDAQAGFFVPDYDFYTLTKQP